jgi:molybdopterin-guanine dinucleotide biosynthesis protein A
MQPGSSGDSSWSEAETQAQQGLAPTPVHAREFREGEPVTGILLAGGRSRRMGRDKNWVTLNGRPLISWVLGALQEVSDHQLIVAREPEQVMRLETLGVPVVVDKIEARGPLTGIHAGLKAIDTDLAVVVACDMPLVRPDLLRLMAGAIGPMHAAVPYVGDAEPPTTIRAGGSAKDSGLQPLLAAYRRSCIPTLEKLLRSGPMPTTALLSVIKTRVVHPEIWREADPDGRSFHNVNTHEDLAAAARMLAGGS